MYVYLVVLSYGLLYRPFCKLSSHSVAAVEARSMLLRTRIEGFDARTSSWFEIHFKSEIVPKINVVNNGLALTYAPKLLILSIANFGKLKNRFFIRYLDSKRNCSWKFSQVVSARTLGIWSATWWSLDGSGVRSKF